MCRSTFQAEHIWHQTWGPQKQIYNPSFAGFLLKKQATYCELFSTKQNDNGCASASLRRQYSKSQSCARIREIALCVGLPMPKAKTWLLEERYHFVTTPNKKVGCQAFFECHFRGPPKTMQRINSADIRTLCMLGILLQPSFVQG